MEQFQLSERTILFLREIRKWSKIIAITGFVAVGLMVVAGVVMLFFMNTLGGEVPDVPSWMGIVYLILFLFLAVVYYFPILYLYRFSENLGQAIDLGNNDFLTDAFEYLMKHYRFVGIMIIIGIILYALSLLAMIVGVMTVSAI